MAPWPSGWQPRYRPARRGHPEASASASKAIDAVDQNGTEASSLSISQETLPFRARGQRARCR